MLYEESKKLWEDIAEAFGTETHDYLDILEREGSAILTRLEEQE